ncbi:MAG: hypothetical protein NT096_01540 [Proteobacteria bacterium]|nr:hypothetical protein [Pseudomonadota bacterium]
MSSPRVEFILKNLSKKEQREFLEEVLEHALSEKRGLSTKDVKEIILSWEATAEINASPRSKNKILSRSNKLRQFLLQTKHA